jgi:hypothetical protein
MQQRKGLSAWQITWEWSGLHAEPQNKIVEILNPRISSEQVRKVVDLLYEREASLSEKVARRLRRQEQPYKAEFSIIQGVRWTGEIICGHNPWLLARLVDNLIIYTNADGTESASWSDNTRPGGPSLDFET